MIGDTIRSARTIEQRRTFLEELQYFMNKSEAEQAIRLRGRLPDLEEFWQYRIGTSAVRVVLALNSYCNDLDDVPPEVLKDADYCSLLDLTNINICAVNDLLSVKKELAQGAVENLVAILFASTGSTALASHGIMEIVRASKIGFDAKAKQFLQRYAFEDDAAHVARRLVEGCKFYSTGNLDWRYVLSCIFRKLTGTHH